MSTTIYFDNKPVDNDGNSIGYSWFLGNSKNLGLPSTLDKTKNYYITEYGLVLGRLINPNYAIYDINNNKIANANQITTNATTIKAKIQFNSIESTEETLSTNKYSLTGTKQLNGETVYASDVSYAPITDKSSNLLKFKFSNPVKIKTNNDISISITGGSASNNGFTVGSTLWEGSYIIVEKTTLSLDKTNIMITDRSSNPDDDFAFADETLGIKSGYAEKVNYLPSGSNLSFEFTNESDKNIIDISDYPNSSYFIVSSKTTDLDYRYNDVSLEAEPYTITVNSDYGKQLINVNFFEKIKRPTDNLSLSLNYNARDFLQNNSYYVDVGVFYYHTDAAKAKKLLYLNKILDFTLDNNQKINLSRDVFNLSSNINNLYQIENDNTVKNYTYEFYNDDVQTPRSILGRYKKDVSINLKLSIVPAEESQLSFDYLDFNNKVITPVSTILLDQDNIMIGNLVYKNQGETSGYCRGFRLQFTDYNDDSVIYKTFDKIVSESEQGYTITTGKVLTDFSDLPIGKPMALYIIPYFYFNNDETTIYSKIKKKVETKFIRIDDSLFLPTLVFPYLDESHKDISLIDIERFGYEFNSEILNLWDELNCKFGLLVNGYTIYPDENTEYFSTNHVVEHLLFDLGNFILNHDVILGDPDINVKPFVVFDKGTEKERTIYGNTVFENQVYWSKPVAKQGEIIKISDLDKYLLFLTKYKFFNNGEVPHPSVYLIEGDTITVSYWEAMSDEINHYVNKMKEWLSLSEITNKNIAWMPTEIDIRQGEKITVNNLKQNYYNLLIKLNYSTVYSTYKYLNTQGYTHKYLNNYTYKQIRNRLEVK